MIQADIDDAGSQLRALVARAEAGDEVILARRGAPVVRLQPVTREARVGDMSWSAWKALDAEIAADVAAATLAAPAAAVPPIRDAGEARRLQGLSTPDLIAELLVRQG